MPAMNVALSAALVAVLNTALQLVISFGVNLTETQNASITALVNALLVLAGVVEHLRIQKANAVAPPVR